MSEFYEYDELLAACEEVLQYKFQDRKLLKLSLTHASIANVRIDSNERLEFLGDTVLGLIVCEMLFHRFPESTEGELTRLKSILVSRNTCAIVCHEQNLCQFLLLGKGISQNNTIPGSIQGGAIEAIIAAIYFDGGLEPTREIVERWMLPQLEAIIDDNHGENFKSLLQQFSQKQSGETPTYRLLEEKGPDHDKSFHISAVIGSRVFPPAWGSSKKESEQAAAKLALSVVESEES